MDLLRGIAILLVILHHSTQIVAYRIGDVPEVFAFISAFFAPYRMPMLMFLSGLLVAGSLTRPTGEYIWGKVRRILWPIVVWTIVYAGAEYLADPAQAKYMPWELGFWNTYLWFMQFVFAYYLIALLIKRIPIWVLIVFSFNDSRSLTWPLSGFTLEWYGKLWENADLQAAIGNSFYVAILATALTLVKVA